MAGNSSMFSTVPNTVLGSYKTFILNRILCYVTSNLFVGGGVNKDWIISGFECTVPKEVSISTWEIA